MGSRRTEQGQQLLKITITAADCFLVSSVRLVPLDHSASLAVVPRVIFQALMQEFLQEQREALRIQRLDQQGLPQAGAPIRVLQILNLLEELSAVLRGVNLDQ